MRSLPVAITVLGLAVAAGCTRTTRTVLVVPEARSEGGPSTAATLGVPPGHLPKPGQCRIWIPGVPPGHQPRPKSRSCEGRSEEHTSELQSLAYLVCRLLLEKKKKFKPPTSYRSSCSYAAEH